MIRNVIFDIGNVLMKFDYMPFIISLLKDEKKIEKVNDAIWMSGYWNDLDRGYDAQEMLQKMIGRQPDYAYEIRLTFDKVGQCMHRAEYAIPWIKDLKSRGYRVLYLSNYAEHTMDANRDVLDFLPYMDGGIFSCYEGIVKPDHGIFRRLVTRYGLVPEECVFIDDSEANVRAAIECGMHAIHFTGHEEAGAELEKLLSSL